MILYSGDGSLSMGAASGPVSPMNYKRAILRHPPREFTVEVLPPAKQGHNWSYGLRVCPIIRQASDSLSVSSRSSSYVEYDIWRRWEDCLDFQETLEEEYGNMSRQKVKILKRGKKGEDNRPYTLNNAAASFESLPEGPDPREIAVDVHNLIPSLTRKGTLFRVSRNTVKQRGDEFAAMILALFNPSEEAPVLLRELRNCTPVRNFFGFWRRDEDYQKKNGKEMGNFSHSNLSFSSLPSSALSSPCSTEFSSAPSSPTSPFKQSMALRGRSQGMSNSLGTGTARTPASAPPGPYRVTSNLFATSPLGTSQQRDGFVALPDRSIIFTDEILLEDDTGTDAEPLHSRPSTPLSAPPWNPGVLRYYDAHLARPMKSKFPDPIPEDDLPRPLPRPTRAPAMSEHRNARIFGSEDLIQSDIQGAMRQNACDISTPPSSPSQGRDLFPSPTSSLSTSSSSCPSSASMTHFSGTSSISSYTQTVSKSPTSKRDSRESFDSGVSIEFDIPFEHPSVVLRTSLSEVWESDIPPFDGYRRNSTASFASGRTEFSADGAIPRCFLAPPPHRRSRSLSLDSRGNSRTLTDRRPAPRIDESLSEGGEDSLEAYLDGLPQLTSRPTITMHSIGSTSSVGSLESHVPWSPMEDAFAVKVLYGDCVVLFRADQSMTLATIREKIRDKFAVHEDVPLDDDFVLAYIPSHAAPQKANVTATSGRSDSSVSSTSNMLQMERLDTEENWQSVVTTYRGKITLRILDA